MRWVLLFWLLAGGSYVSEIEQWRQKKEAALKADDGWLTVAGLHWLREGTNNIEGRQFSLRGDKVLHRGKTLRRTLRAASWWARDTAGDQTVRPVCDPGPGQAESVPEAVHGVDLVSGTARLSRGGPLGSVWRATEAERGDGGECG